MYKFTRADNVRREVSIFNMEGGCFARYLSLYIDSEDNCITPFFSLLASEMF